MSNERRYKRKKEKEVKKSLKKVMKNKKMQHYWDECIIDLRNIVKNLQDLNNSPLGLLKLINTMKDTVNDSEIDVINGFVRSVNSELADCVKLHKKIKEYMKINSEENPAELDNEKYMEIQEQLLNLGERHITLADNLSITILPIVVRVKSKLDDLKKETKNGK